MPSRAEVRGVLCGVVATSDLATPTSAEPMEEKGVRSLAALPWATLSPLCLGQVTPELRYPESIPPVTMGLGGVGLLDQEPTHGSWTSGFQNLTLPPTGCVRSGKSDNFSVPRFPHHCQGDDKVAASEGSSSSQWNPGCFGSLPTHRPTLGAGPPALPH